MRFTYSSYVEKEDQNDPWSGRTLDRKITFNIDGDMILDEVIDKFVQFLRASGFDYVRMYPEGCTLNPSADRWVIDKKIYEDFGAYRPDEFEREINF
jgi:hypothetical protein